MKFFHYSVLAALALTGSHAMAHDIHRTASDHFHPGPVYTHTVASAYDHHNAHHAHHYGSSSYYHYTPYNLRIPRVTTNTATYYTRSYPVKKTHQYVTTPNTTIHHPPYAYSSCAHRCDRQSQRITVSTHLGANTLTYRAPSEYSAQDKVVLTPRTNYHPYHNQQHYTNTHVSPFKKHQLTTTTCYHCY